MSDSNLHLGTRAIHSGEHGTDYAGAVTAPIFQSATYIYGGESQYGDVKYMRLNNSPTHSMLHEKLAALEGAESALVTASGMAAITTALLTIFEKPSGHLLAQNCLYGGTSQFLSHDFKRMGHHVSFLNMSDVDSWTVALRKYPDTRAFYVETITNPLLEVVDLKRVVKFCRENNLVSIIDNTLASPVNFKPIAMGFDLVLHSCSKYLNGHSDLVAGCVVGNKKWIGDVNKKLIYLGGCLDAHACFLLNRGIKTLVVRVNQQNANALRVAKWLSEQTWVKKVMYPGLETHPDHARARRLLSGFGGMVSFEFNGSAVQADACLARLKLPKVAPSLGGVESLITRPCTTSHSGIGPEERARMGVSDQLIRFSVGIEDADDLIADLRQAFGS